MKQHTFPTLYKRTSTGAVQQWIMEVDDNRFRTISGQVGGAQVTSNWTKCSGKNIGRSNETTPHEQAMSEARSRHTKQLDKHYFENVADIDKVRYHKVMLAKSYKDQFHRMDKTLLYSQTKSDGIRSTVTVDNILAGRSGKPIHSAPHIWEDIRQSGVYVQFPDIVFDGELYADALSDNFEKIVSLAKKQKPTEQDLADSRRMLQYWIYDIIIPSRPEVTFYERNMLLDGIFSTYFPGLDSLVRVPTTLVTAEEDIDRLYQGYLEAGQEGQILRNGHAPYEGKRSANLLKRKEFIDDEFEIVDIREGLGNWSGHAKSIEFRTKDGKPFDAGIRGTQDFCLNLLVNRDMYIGRQATVRYQNLSSAGIPRFPVVHVIHETERW